MDSFNKSMLIVLAVIVIALAIYTNWVIAGVILFISIILAGKLDWGKHKEFFKREPIPQWVKNEVLKIQNNCCSYCGNNFDSPFVIEFHHIKPIIHGGKSDDPYNISALHANCHNLLTRGRNFNGSLNN